MGFGCCLVCEMRIESGPVVVAEVLNNEAVSFAHAQCWIDSGRDVIGPEEIRLMFGAAALPVCEESQLNHVRDAVRANP